MTVKYCIKTHQTLMTGVLDKYYSPPDLNAALATGERFVIQARITGFGGVSQTITVGIETSNDNVNWQQRSTPISVAVTGSHIGVEKGETTVGGRFMRVSVQFGGTGTVFGFTEIWVCGRSFY